QPADGDEDPGRHRGPAVGLAGHRETVGVDAVADPIRGGHEQVPVDRGRIRDQLDDREDGVEDIGKGQADDHRRQPERRQAAWSWAAENVVEALHGRRNGGTPNALVYRSRRCGSSCAARACSPWRWRLAGWPTRSPHGFSPGTRPTLEPITQRPSGSWPASPSIPRRTLKRTRS